MRAGALLALAGVALAATGAHAQSKPFFNELQADQVGEDADEFIEVVVPITFDITGLAVREIEAKPNSSEAGTVDFIISVANATVGDQIDGFQFYVFRKPNNGLFENSATAFILSTDDGAGKAVAILDAIIFGTDSVTPKDADLQTADFVRVPYEGGVTPGNSISLTDNGWQFNVTATPGGLNVDQTLTVDPPVPFGLPFINELSTDVAGQDDGPNEFVEVAVPDGYDITGLTLREIDAKPNSDVTGEIDSTFRINETGEKGNTVDGFVFYTLRKAIGFENGETAFILSRDDENGTALEVLDSVIFGVYDVVVKNRPDLAGANFYFVPYEKNSLVPTTSLSLTDAGWINNITATPGDANEGQTVFEPPPPVPKPTPSPQAPTLSPSPSPGEQPTPSPVEQPTPAPIGCADKLDSITNDNQQYRSCVDLRTYCEYLPEVRFRCPATCETCGEDVCFDRPIPGLELTDGTALSCTQAAEFCDEPFVANVCPETCSACRSQSIVQITDAELQASLVDAVPLEKEEEPPQEGIDPMIIIIAGAGGGVVVLGVIIALVVKRSRSTSSYAMATAMSAVPAKPDYPSMPALPPSRNPMMMQQQQQQRVFISNDSHSRRYEPDYGR